MDTHAPNESILAEAAGGAAVCLGHDWLTGMRGGERVLEYFCRAFPLAPVAAIVGDPALVSRDIASHRLLLSPLGRLPGAVRQYRKMLPLLPWAAGRTRIPPETRLLLTTSHCVAKGFRKPDGAKHLSVVFTPMRYAWTFYEEYFGTSRAKAALVKPLLAHLRAWDRRTAAGVDRFVAISNHVAKRIKDFYGRESTVVYPPVDLVRCTPGVAPGEGGFDLVVSALVPYKKVDLAVRVYSKRGWPLKVVGAGGCEAALRAALPPGDAITAGGVAETSAESQEPIIAVVPLMLLLPRWGLGSDGVFWSEPVSDLLGGGAAFITMLLTVYRPIARELKQEEMSCQS